MASILDVEASDWEEKVLGSVQLTLVEFWHHNCPFCKKLNPIIDELAEEYKDKLKFFRVNVLTDPKNREIALENGVMGTPTIVFFCSGRSVGTVVGFQPKERLRSTLNDMLENYRKCLDQSTEVET